jgi:hypothetical protein
MSAVGLTLSLPQRIGMVSYLLVLLPIHAPDAAEKAQNVSRETAANFVRNSITPDPGSAVAPASGEDDAEVLCAEPGAINAGEQRTGGHELKGTATAGDPIELRHRFPRPRRFPPRRLRE